LIENNSSTRYALKLFYLGDNYHGYQRQKDKNTIEKNVIDALKEVKVIKSLKDAQYGYSSRTDKYVHSLGQIVSFYSDSDIRIPEINHHLPKDIKFYAKTITKKDFEPRYQALSRHYKYITINEDYDFSSMRASSKEFLGEHDFKILSKSPYPKKIMRKIYNIDVQLLGNSFICIDVIGRSFLYEMVRRIAYLIIEVGKNNLQISEIKKYFNPANLKTIKIKAAPIKNLGALVLYDCDYGLEFEYNDYSIKMIKRMLKNRIINGCIVKSSSKVLHNFFNRII
jgi:tRNA pseudouridine38-40 synthase